MLRRMLLSLMVLVLAAAGVSAQEEESGQVQLPLDVYNQLVDSARDPSTPPRPAPVSHALGSARVTVQVPAVEPQASGAVSVDLSIDVFEAEWVLIPVLPAGTPVETATVGGSAVQLVPTPSGLAWSTNRKGAYNMKLTYRVDATRSEGGYSLAVPVPQAAAIKLSATLPGSGIDVSVIPAAGTDVSTSGSTTRVSATVPTTSGIHISWRTPTDRGHAISRASYSGRLAGDAVTWTGELGVQLFSDETVTLRLLPRSVTMVNVKVDGENGAILVEGDRFATLVKGQGLHKVVVEFQVPVLRQDGPPRIALQVPPIPVSRFELSLPGKKEVSVTPASSVTSSVRGDTTVAVVNVPMTEQVTISWAEAVPEEISTEVRGNASLFHAAYAEEGVLYVRAMVAYEITRGETATITLELPPAVQINRISAASGAVADWRLSGPPEGKPREVTIFLNRQVKGDLVFEVAYDRSLPTGGESGRFEVPLLRAAEAQRERGMVALLASRDLTLRPVDEGKATRVGENQLPAFFRETIELTVAHTFKYVEEPPRLEVEAIPPERKQGKYDARIDTLISLGEVTMTGSASVEVNVKSGSTMDLAVDLPPAVNVLSLTAPSLRTYKVEPDDQGGQLIDVQFTQEMEGQFRLEVTYERILVDGEEEVTVPTLAVRGAEVEQGRIAVEALSAVEVQASAAEQLSALDPGELPQQLILRTTNPILLAYKYAHTDPPYRLTLKVTRHEVLGVQEAAIDRAEYRTLFTQDGLAVTTAFFTVRNSRKQFLRVRLPEGSTVWSAFVDGKPEKPALAEGSEAGDGVSVLIKIINSTTGFRVDLIYATSGSKIRGLGKVRGILPRPDILVTDSRWDIFVPAELNYGKPSSNMELVESGTHVTRDELENRMARVEAGAEARPVIEPLRIVVPTAGIHYAFQKLYANQSQDDAWFAIPYASGIGTSVGLLVSMLGALLLWAGVGLLLVRPPKVHRSLGPLGVAVGAVLLVLTIGLYHVSFVPATVVSVLVVLGLGALQARRMRSGGPGHTTE